MEETVFDRIIRREIPADIVAESGDLLAFRDIRPLAPVHVLIIPKRRIPSIDALSDTDADLVGRMILMARDIARDLNISEKGYKLLFRTGRDGGQEIPHIHLHLIGGARLTEGIGPVNKTKKEE
ncbi:MAG: histidine triad nucleotide-binding protein [Candidatus Moranbacteria bacterium]|nr:histidine triad nucleotide-binding protein [Candidatus Moranbacteria bacterium]NTW46193.1 histidine triad nucleotide-binding protein [Candidatus Moranbacteria bacterium]